MRLLIAVCLLSCAFAAAPAKADPYRWCEQLNVSGGALNCYFVTLEQCRAAASGMGGFCVPNTFYTGPAEARPYETQAEKPKRRR
jgi:hypothetical protein